MFLHFYIQGSQPGAKAVDSSEGHLSSMINWTGDGFSRLSDMSFDDVVDGVRARAAGVAESSKALFRFLSGEPTSTPSANQPPTREPVPAEKEPNSVWSFAGLFSGIKGKRHGDGLHAADGRVFLEGEAHAELVRNDQGYFDFKDLIVEIPSVFLPRVYAPCFQYSRLLRFTYSESHTSRRNSVWTGGLIVERFVLYNPLLHTLYYTTLRSNLIALPEIETPI